MPEAKFQIKRKCEVCGNTFIAKTLDSRYCCRHCTDIAYKKRKAAKAKEERLNQIAQLIPGEREFISIKEAVAMYAISRDTLYRLIRKGKLPYINIGERLTRISREQLEKIVPLREEPLRTNTCCHVFMIWTQRIATQLVKSPRNSGLMTVPYGHISGNTLSQLARLGTMYMRLKRK